MTKPAQDDGTPAAIVPHARRWQLGNRGADGDTPGRCECGETRVFTDEQPGTRGRMKRDALSVKRPRKLIVEPTK